MYNNVHEDHVDCKYTLLIGNNDIHDWLQPWTLHVIVWQIFQCVDVWWNGMEHTIKCCWRMINSCKHKGCWVNINIHTMLSCKHKHKQNVADEITVNINVWFDRFQSWTESVSVPFKWKSSFRFFFRSASSFIFPWTLLLVVKLPSLSVLFTWNFRFFSSLLLATLVLFVGESTKVELTTDRAMKNCAA